MHLFKVMNFPFIAHRQTLCSNSIEFKHAKKRPSGLAPSVTGSNVVNKDWRFKARTKDLKPRTVPRTCAIYE